MNLLLTAFRGSSAEYLVKGSRYDTLLLPNDKEKDAKVLFAALRHNTYDYIISLGQRPNIKNKVHIETTACNGGSSLETGFDCEYFQGMLLQNGITARLSQNAGTSYCNSIYWNGMSYLAEHGLHTRMVFLHVPFRKNIGAMEESLKNILTERLHTLLPESRVLVFDLGGTLMEYTGMPASWTDYYEQGFAAIDRYYDCNASASDIKRSVEILTSFNPRVCYREEEYAPEVIFAKALEHWQKELPSGQCAYKFYEGLNLKAVIYPDVIPALTALKGKGYRIAALTDLPTAMPEELFQKDIALLLPYLDFYVSSLSCGFRKPNGRGLQLIAERYHVPVTELTFIGDEEKDRETAHRAGCRFLRMDRKEKNRGDICDLYGVKNLS